MYLLIACKLAGLYNYSFCLDDRNSVRHRPIHLYVLSVALGG